jgi:hypothetical protein
MRRRDLIRIGAATVATVLQPELLHAMTNKVSPAAGNENLPTTDKAARKKIEQWGMFELELLGPSAGNPFKEVTLSARFTLQHRSMLVTGFYDGDGVYRVRFMPDSVGRWSYVTESSAEQLRAHAGEFECVSPTTAGNHGPVVTAHQFHFQYADGTPYFPFGTTTYAYLFTSEENAQAAVNGIREACFNKSRMCVLPKPLGDGPHLLPFPSTVAETDRRSGINDLTRFNPAYFQLIEHRLMELQRVGVEADLILFHPYDSWGYKAMGAEADDFYLRYAIARLSAFRNIWWSIANEYDLVKAKSMSDWDRFFRIVQAEDPYSHLRSIHHSRVLYDHGKPWCTHASLQSYDFERSAERRAAWNKPIIYDEIQYEGNIDRRWGNLSAEEMTRRFWLAVLRGAYATHGEVFLTDSDAPSSADAGRMRGESGVRIAYLRALVERITKVGLTEVEGAYYLSAGTPEEMILYYFDYHRPVRYEFPLPTTAAFSATLIDPFAMTMAPVTGAFTGKSQMKLSGKPYQAVLFQKISSTKSKSKSGDEPLVPTNEPG